MNYNDTLKTLKQEIIELHRTISKIYSGEIKTGQNALQLIHQLTYLNTEYKRLKSLNK
ncbi:hypothetical protein [Petroclostridium sp. X23]|uniref:hypothetical protein n=1 Tax=Petroclostridium sp. X23 TaxID=3045146 RepID=UPI0024AD1108|nr:hypothetical protein [Petroclostridium sp. X23]WHH57848.1 hypothetical protein QKW49_18810 [Petroclostridium sp. X23]